MEVKLRAQPWWRRRRRKRKWKGKEEEEEEKEKEKYDQKNALNPERKE